MHARAPQPAFRTENVSDNLVELLSQLGVEKAFGVIGGAIAPFFDAVGRSKLHLVHCRHEAGAAFAAMEAYFASGKPAAVVTTSGPGLSNALTGMMAARWDGAKVILISGAHSPAQRGRWPAQETSSYTMPMSGIFTAGPIFHYALMMEHAAELEQIGWRLAAGLARPGPFVAHLSLPIGLQTTPAPKLREVGLSSYVPAGCAASTAEPIAQMLKGRFFVIWAGFGARGASQSLLKFAERTGAPVICTPRAKGVFPESHPQFLGVTGMGGHATVEAYLAAHRPDHMLVLGSRLAETASFWDAAMLPTQSLIHVDVDPEAPGAAYPHTPTVVVQSEIGAFLQALLEHCPPNRLALAPPPGPASAMTPIPHQRVRPVYLIDVMQRVVVEQSDAVVLAESGNAFAWAINGLSFDAPGRFRVSSSFGAMGHCTSGVVGAALARNGKAVALVGDGSMLMNNEISTAVQYKASAVWVVLNDGQYGMVAQGMRALGFTPYETSFPSVDFTLVARGMGADGVQVSDERALEEAMRQAMASPRPFVVDVLVDPNEPGPWMKRIQNLILAGREREAVGCVEAGRWLDGPRSRGSAPINAQAEPRGGSPAGRGPVQTEEPNASRDGNHRDGGLHPPGSPLQRLVERGDGGRLEAQSAQDRGEPRRGQRGDTRQAPPGARRGSSRRSRTTRSLGPRSDGSRRRRCSPPRWSSSLVVKLLPMRESGPRRSASSWPFRCHPTRSSLRTSSSFTACSDSRTLGPSA
ncbi:MAG: thiamine pyrophosphate-binding protein [Myxococcales bacterium]